MKLISIPVAVHVDLFKWQLDLFWFNHQRTYGDDAKERAKAIIIKRNHLNEPKYDTLQWDTTIPHVMCESAFDYAPPNREIIPLGGVALPLNIQIGLAQILSSFDDDQVIEVNDCDMFHFRKHPEMNIGDDELYVCDLYEDWHLKSLSDHKNVIERYFENGGKYYNGGFVPIIGKVRTFKKILYEWVAVHIDILKCGWSDLIQWWAGMYALQAACEKAKVTMIAKNFCYIPGVNQLSDEHYICHYSCDPIFNKKKFPNILTEEFPDNLYFNRILEWLETQSFGKKVEAAVQPQKFYHGRELDHLGVMHNADKSSLVHNTLECYEFFMARHKYESFVFMEIGLYQGASLRVWRDYFPSASILGVDINEDCRNLAEDRIIIEIGDGSDPTFLRQIQNKYQPLIILDDASHRWSHQIAAFEALFPQLPQGGIYICEDIHTSFRPLADAEFCDQPLDAFTYFSTLSSLVAGNGNPPQSGVTHVAPTAFQQSIAASISSITIRRHTLIITK